MKRKMRSNKSLTVKKRVVGFFAIAVILLGVIGGFSLTHVIAESNSDTGGGAERSAAIVANTSESSDDLSGGGGTNASVLLSDDNTGTSTGSQAKTVDTGTTPTVNINNMSTYPQTGDAHDTGLVITGVSILIGLFAFYGYKLRKNLQFLQASK